VLGTVLFASPCQRLFPLRQQQVHLAQELTVTPTYLVLDLRRTARAVWAMFQMLQIAALESEIGSMAGRIKRKHGVVRDWALDVPAAVAPKALTQPKGRFGVRLKELLAQM